MQGHPRQMGHSGILTKHGFPVIMYICESWSINKDESLKLMLLNCGAGEDFSDSFELQGDQTSQS